MTSARLLLRLIPLLLALLSTPMARADVYSDVSQLVRGGRLTEAEARADRHLKAKPRDALSQRPDPA
jgi:hypothetical protein